MAPASISSLRPPSGSGRRSLGFLVALTIVFVAELFLFDHFGSHRVTAIYPRWNDQIQYLSESYTGFEYARTHGLAAGLWQTLVNPSAQGTLHDFEAVILFQFVGPSRSAALALNMLAMIAWQAALYFAFARRSRSRALAWLAAVLPLALGGPWQNVPGSAYDFRLDHLAMCALGVTSALALVADRFRHRGGSILFGAAVGVTLLTRFLTGTYFVLIFAAAVVWVIVNGERARRWANLALAALVAAVMAGPIFWVNREWVWNYYYIGHYVGPESAIRNQNFGLGRSIAYVFGWLAERHLGWFFAVLVATVSVALAGLQIARRLRSNQPTTATGSASPHPDLGAGEIAFWGGVFLLGPALILVLHPQKSVVVLSALAPGVVLLVIGSWCRIGRGLWSGDDSGWRGLTAVVAGMVVATMTFFTIRQCVPVENAAAMANFRQVNAAADYVFEHTQSLPHPRISVDYITDAFDAQVLRVICYERHHVWKDFDMRLPTGIAEPDSALVRERLAESDFVFLTDQVATPGPYPFDKKLAALRPELRSWCETHLRAVKQFSYFGRGLTLYQRPDLK